MLTKTFTLAKNIANQMLPLAKSYCEYIAMEEPLACLVDGELVYQLPKKSDLSFIQLSSEITWVSKGGLVYGPDRKFGSRIQHVLQHTIPNNTKLNHTVFTVPEKELFDLIDFAWSKKRLPLPNDPGTYIVDLGKVIGTLGETAIKIVTIAGTNNILTAYPVKV